jgi:hypothetical protein
MPDFSQTQTSFDNNSYHLYFDRVKKGRHVTLSLFKEKIIKELVNSREPFLTVEDIENIENKNVQERREKREKKASSQEHSGSLEKTHHSNKPVKEKKVESEGVNMNLKAFNKKKEEEEKKEEKSNYFLTKRGSYTFVNN